MKKLSTIIAVALVLACFVIFTGYRYAAIPSEVQADISIYPGAEIISSDPINKGGNVVLDVNAAMTDIHEFYAAEMTRNGWTVLTTRDNFLAFSKGRKGIMIDVETVLEKKSRVTISYLDNV